MDEPMTDSRLIRAVTRETEETDTPTNGQFLRTLFGDGGSEHRPVVVSFHGNPAEVAKSAWFGHPWQGGEVAESAANNYPFRENPRLCRGDSRCLTIPGVHLGKSFM